MAVAQATKLRTRHDPLNHTKQHEQYRLAFFATALAPLRSKGSATGRASHPSGADDQYRISTAHRDRDQPPGEPYWFQYRPRQRSHLYPDVAPNPARPFVLPDHTSG